VIYAGVNGYLDPLPVSSVSRFEAELLRNIPLRRTPTFSIRSATPRRSPRRPEKN